MTIRVVVADDHGIVRDGLAAVLSAIDGHELVGTATNGHEAVKAAVTLGPDVLIMDIAMPEHDGVEATREVRRVAPGVSVLMLTMFDDDDSLFAAIRAGALGYVLKGAPAATIVRAVDAVAEGHAVFGPGLARRALQRFAAPEAAKPPFEELTTREHEILNLIAAGLSNTAIADRLRLRPKTVSNHITSVFAKLQVQGRAEAIIRARSKGLGK